jgi:ketosteroid isomerase-like protein
MMKIPAKEVIEKMFAAFAEGNVEKILDTVSEDSVWIYHGTQIIPKARFEGKDGAQTFFSNILKHTEVLRFEPRQYIVEGDMVVVLGSEHQRVKRSGRELRQQWVQVYTVKNNLITRMEEFATSEVGNDANK